MMGMMDTAVVIAAQEKAHAAHILEKADKALAEVDDAYILTNRNHVVRAMPRFRPEEITLGNVLGEGGFGIVNEIKSFCLDDDQKDNGATPACEATIMVETAYDMVHDADDHTHYEISKARELMSMRAQRNGTARYAIKRLRDDLTELERARGMVDLALEAKFLSIVWHPNISEYSFISSIALP
jgi:hypothetical protein